LRREIIFALLAACGSASPKPAPASHPTDAPRYDPAELTEIAEGLFDIFETMAVTVEAHPHDCPAMARDLTRLFDGSAPIVARAKEVAADPQAARGLRAEMKKHEADERALVDRITAGLQVCAGDPDLAAAMEKMPLLD
jgi:hypothetical protein